jgi:thiamine-monophosphate kinase
MRPELIARKSVVSCISDFAAKGVKPEACMLSLGIPKGKGDEWIKRFIDGFRRAGEEFGFEIIGGDVNESKEVIVDCFLYGKAGRKTGRNGAKIGDMVMATGFFGITKMGLMHLLEGRPLPAGMKRMCLNSVLKPSPPLQFGLRVIGGGMANASMDSSDGLAVTLHEIAKQSGKGIVIERLPTPRGFIEKAVKLGYDPLDLILYGGEEFQIVFTVKPTMVRRISSLAKKMNVPLTVIGKVEEGEGVLLRTDKEAVEVKEKGWVHLYER